MTDIPSTLPDLLSLIKYKRELFGKDKLVNTDMGCKVLNDLELLLISLSELSPEQASPDYISGIYHSTPSLQSKNLGSVIEWKPVTKTQRRREVIVPPCEGCNGPTTEGVCTRCGLSSGRITSSIARSKTKDTLNEKQAAFPSTLDVLLALVPLDSKIHPYQDAIKQDLITRGFDITKGRTIPVDIIRNSFEKVDIALNGRATVLRAAYVWCSTMRYAITGYRPKPLNASERILLQEYYNRALSSFYNLMNAPSTSGKQISNMWNVQAYIKLILVSSPMLLTNHVDLLETLHNQNSNTEEDHCKIWETMARSGEWVFK